MDKEADTSAPVSRGARKVPAVAAWLAVLLAVHLLVYGQHWLGRMTFPHDFPMGYYGATAYWIASVQAGQWPHWLPYQSMGYPFAMNVQSGLFYPPFWIFAALGLPYTLHAATICQLLHILAGAVGMFLLVRAYWGHRLVAGTAAIAFGLFGGFFSNAEHPDIIRAFALTPWVLWAALVTEAPVRQVRLGRWGLATRLSARHLLLPLALYFFVTGAYAGNMIAGCFLLAIFLAVQGACLAQRGPAKTALTDTVVLGGLFALGLALAAPYLAPPAVLGAEYVRTEDFGEMGRRYLEPAHAMYLVFPNSVGFDGQPAQGDWSMLAMQLPVVLLPFLAVVRRRDLRELAPLLGIGLVSVVMAFDAFIPVSRLVRAACPPLGYSRFPAGDYRLLLYLAVLLPCLAGVRRVLAETASPRPALAVRIAAASLLLVGLALALLLGGLVPAADISRFLWLLGWQAVGLAVLVVMALAARRPKYFSLFASGVPVLCAVMLWPVPMELRRYWRTRDAEWRNYGMHGVALQEDGRLCVAALFERPVDRPRPPRMKVPEVFHASWRGYINGSYMMSDCGGLVSRSRRAVENNPDLERLMLQPSTLLAVEGGDGQPAGEVALPPLGADRPGPLRQWRIVEYARNHVRYQVTLARPALVVENELYFPGWTGRLEGGGELRPVRVAGALRGWALPAGTHDLRLDYRTPGLALGTKIAAAALAAYAAVALCGWRGAVRARSAAPAEHCGLPPGTVARTCHARAA